MAYSKEDRELDSKEINKVLEQVKENQNILGVRIPEPPESTLEPTTDCGGNCAIAFIVDVTQCQINCPSNILDAHIHIQSSPTATPIILADVNGNPITAANVIPNNTGHSVAVFTAIAKFENKLFVIIKYYTPSSAQTITWKLVKLHLHVNCTASVIWTKDNFLDSRALCAVDEDTLILAQVSNVIKIDLTSSTVSQNGTLLQYVPTTLFNITYGIGGGQTNTQYLTATLYDMIEDLVYIPSSDIVAVLVNGGNTGLYTPEILTYQISDWNNAFGCGGQGAGPCNLQVGTSGAFPLGGINYQSPAGNLSLYCYNGNIFTHNSEGNIWEWQMDAQGDISMIQGPSNVVGWGSHLLNVFYGYGDAASSPICCGDSFDDPIIYPCPEIGDIGPGGGLVFAVPYTQWNNTKYFYEVGLTDLSTGGTPLSSQSFQGCGTTGQTLTGAEWGAYGDGQIQTGHKFGDGRKNTDIIHAFPLTLNIHPTIWDTSTNTPLRDIAATLCVNYGANPEKEEWYLPSLFEWMYMLTTVGYGTIYETTLNLSTSVIDPVLNSFNSDGVYWTSSEYSSFDANNPTNFNPGTLPPSFPGEEKRAWSVWQDPWNGIITPLLSQRCSTMSVRPIRRFECKPPPPPPDPPQPADPGIEYDYRIQSHNAPGGISFISHNRTPQDVPGYPMNPYSGNPPSGSPGFTGPYPNYAYPFDLAWDEKQKIGGKWMYMTTNNFDIRGNQLGISQLDMMNKINAAHLPTMPTVNNSGTGVPITIKIYSQDETLIAHYEYERFWMTYNESQNTFFNNWFTGTSQEPLGDPGVGTCAAGTFSGTHCSWKTKWRLYNEVYSITPGQIIDLDNYSGVNAMINDLSNTAGPIGYVTLDWALSGTTVDLNNITGTYPQSTAPNIPTDRGNTANLSTHLTGNKRITDMNNFPSPGFEWPHTCNDCGTSWTALSSHRHMLEVEPTPSSYFWNNTVYTNYLDSVNGVVGGSCGGGTITGGTQAKLLDGGCSDFPTLKELKNDLAENPGVNKYKRQNKKKYR